MSSAVVDVTVDRNRAVIVEFADGIVGEYPVRELRAACPCATCRARRDAGRPAWDGTVGPSIVSAEFAGAWGLSIEWHDGHSTGIYPWSSLRRWHDAGLNDDGHGLDGGDGQ